MDNELQKMDKSTTHENEIPPQQESSLSLEKQHYDMKEKAARGPKSRILEGDAPEMEDETVGEMKDPNKGLKEDAPGLEEEAVEEPKDLNKDLEEDGLSEGEIRDPIEDWSPFNAE
jgi:hypothetical protein